MKYNFSMNPVYVPAQSIYQLSRERNKKFTGIITEKKNNKCNKLRSQINRDQSR